MSISIRNLNSPTSPFWGKTQAAALFVSSTIMGTALATHNDIMGWISFGLTIIAGLIPIYTNGPKNETPPAT